MEKKPNAAKICMPNNALPSDSNNALDPNFF